MLTGIFFPVFKAVFAIFFVAIVSGLLVRKNIIKQTDIQSLSHITIMVLLPCLFFSKIINSFDPYSFKYWYILPLVAYVMIGFALGVSFLLFYKNWKQKKALIAVASFMNANYMVLPIAMMIYKTELDEFLTYCFLFILGVTTALWSVGKYLVTSGDNEKIKLSGVLNPPLVAILVSVTIVLLGGAMFIPDLVMVPIDFISQAAIPIATIVLGATLGSIPMKKLPSILDIVKVAGVKLFIMPAVIILLLYKTQWLINYPLIADLLVLQASVAPATLLIIQVQKYGGNSQVVGGMMLVNYSLCVITIPAWLTLWRMIM